MLTRWIDTARDSLVRTIGTVDVVLMNDDEIRVAFMKYMRRLNDGHTGIRPAEPFPTLPIQVYWFNWSMVHSRGALSGLNRRMRVPCRNRPPVKWSNCTSTTSFGFSGFHSLDRR